MKTVILCGGKGTRLREETEFRPKPMVWIGDRPILWHIMKTYACHGHTDFVLCLGYKGEMIKDYFRNYLWNTCDVTVTLGAGEEPVFTGRHEEANWRITLADTGAESMTAHRVKQIQRYIPQGETFLLTYGDGVATIDVNAAIAEHRASGKVCTISAVHPAGRFGTVSLEPDGSIVTFDEKPQYEEAYVNAGYMVCDYALFDYLSDDPAMMLEREPMVRLAREGQLHAYRHSGFWQPMDTYQECQHLNHLWREGAAPWKIWR